MKQALQVHLITYESGQRSEREAYSNLRPPVVLAATMLAQYLTHLIAYRNRSRNTREMDKHGKRANTEKEQNGHGQGHGHGQGQDTDRNKSKSKSWNKQQIDTGGLTPHTQHPLAR